MCKVFWIWRFIASDHDSGLNGGLSAFQTYQGAGQIIQQCKHIAVISQFLCTNELFRNSGYILHHVHVRIENSFKLFIRADARFFETEMSSWVWDEQLYAVFGVLNVAFEYSSSVHVYEWSHDVDSRCD